MRALFLVAFAAVIVPAGARAMSPISWDTPKLGDHRGGDCHKQAPEPLTLLGLGAGAAAIGAAAFRKRRS